MSPEKSSNFSRRRFLIGLGSAGLVLAAWEMGRATLRFLTPPITRPKPEPVAVGSPPNFARDSLTYIPAARAWLGCDDAGFYALSATCPHLGCTVHQENEGFECPCHGSRFTRQGDVLNGPATAPLTYLAVNLSDGLLMIDPAQAVTSTTRLKV